MTCTILAGAISIAYTFSMHAAGCLMASELTFLAPFGVCLAGALADAARAIKNF